MRKGILHFVFFASPSRREPLSFAAKIQPETSQKFTHSHSITSIFFQPTLQYFHQLYLKVLFKFRIFYCQKIYRPKVLTIFHVSFTWLSPISPISTQIPAGYKLGEQCRLLIIKQALKQMLTAVSKSILFRCSAIKVPVIDVKAFLTESPSAKSDCKQVAEALHKYGCLIIKDPRVNQAQNDKFLDTLEKYFQARSVDYYANKPTKDIYPNYDFQVGATPEYKEKAKDHGKSFDAYSKENKPVTPTPPPFDAKWRYFWDISTDDKIKKRYPNQAPEDFPEFREVMDTWGRHMINGCYTVAQMAAIGMGLDRNTFSEMLNGGEHKLAPTGSDLNKYKVGTVFAGYHYDFNFLTIHGKSRYAGLFAWLRTGQKFTVAVPEGHLLLQAGKQFEYVTGGYINCGYHEVIYTQKVQQQRQKAIKQGKIPWRVSSTLFSHLREDVVLKPIGKFATPQALKQYPPITVRDQTIQELKDTSLSTHY